MSTPKKDMHTLQELVRLHRQGSGAREAARLLGMSRNTVREYREALAAADLPRRAGGRAADAGASQGGAACGLAHADFKGSLSAVKRLCARLKDELGVQPGDVAIPVETTAGEGAQVDFGCVGRVFDPEAQISRKAWVFVMVLGHSRHLFAKIVFDQRAATWQQLHVEAFASFCGRQEPFEFRFVAFQEGTQRCTIAIGDRMNDILASKLKAAWPTHKMKTLYFGYSPNGKTPVLYLDLRPLTKELFLARLTKEKFELTEKGQIWVGKVSEEDGLPTFTVDSRLSTKNFTAAKMKKGLVQIGTDARCGLGGSATRAKITEASLEIDENLAQVAPLVGAVDPDGDAPVRVEPPVDGVELAKRYATWLSTAQEQLETGKASSKAFARKLRKYDEQDLPELERKLELLGLEYTDMPGMVGADKGKQELGARIDEMRKGIRSLRALRKVVEKHHESYVAALQVAVEKRDASIVEYDTAPSPQALAKAGGRLEGALVRVGDHQERLEGVLAELGELSMNTALGLQPTPKQPESPKSYQERVARTLQRSAALKHESEAELRDAKDVRKGSRGKLTKLEAEKTKAEQALQDALAGDEGLAGTRDEVKAARAVLEKVEAVLNKAASVARLLEVKIDKLLAKGNDGLSGDELQELSVLIDQRKTVSVKERDLAAQVRDSRTSVAVAKKKLDGEIEAAAHHKPDLAELLRAAEALRGDQAKAEDEVFLAEREVQRREAEVEARTQIERVAALTDDALTFKAGVGSEVFQLLGTFELDMSGELLKAHQKRDHIAVTLGTFFEKYTVELGRLGATEELEQLFVDVPRVLRPEAVDEYGRGFRELEKSFTQEEIDDAEEEEKKKGRRGKAKKAWDAVSGVTEPVVEHGSKVELLLTGLEKVLPKEGSEKVELAHQALTIALLAIDAAQQVGDNLAEEETQDPVLQRMQDQKVVDAIFAIHDAGIDIASEFVPGLSTAKNGLEMLRGMVEAAERFARSLDDGELGVQAKKAQSALRGALEQSQTREGKLGGKATVDAVGSALSLTGGLITVGGLSAPAGVAVDVAGKVVKVGATVVVKVDDWRIAARALELLDGARRGWADEQRELFRFHPKYAKGLLALAAKNRDPIALRYLQTRGLTEKEVARSTASIIRMFLLSEAGKETDAPKRFSDELRDITSTLASLGAKLLSGLEFIDSHALNIKGCLAQIGEWILGQTAAGKIGAVVEAERVALPMADIREAIDTIQNARALLAEVADVEGVEPSLLTDLQHEIDRCERTLDEIQGPILVYVHALQNGERELAAVVDQSYLKEHAKALLAKLRKRRIQQVALLRELAAAA